MTDPAMNLPMPLAAELMGVHFDISDEKGSPLLLTVTAPYPRQLPGEFVAACLQWAGPNGYVRFVDAANGRAVRL